MKIPIWIPRNTRIPAPARWNALVLPILFILNVFTFSGWFQLGQVPTEPWLLLMWLYGLVVLIPLAWRDRAPVTVFTTQVLAVAAWPVLPHYVPVVGIPVSLYAVTVHRNRKVSVLALLVSFLPNAFAAAVSFIIPSASPAAGIGPFIGNTVFLCLMTVGAWGAGRLTRASRQHVQRLEREQERLQRERETAREAVAAERRRIARELHDIVSHAVTVIVLQAAGAAQVADTDVAQVTESLAHIETSGKLAMVELQRLLGVLDASEPSPGTTDAGDLGPQPGLADLTKLISALQAAGLPVIVHTAGTPRELDPSVDLAAYRIVQEGLTNILKHAGKDPNPQLRLAWDPHNLRIQIDNDTNAETPNTRALSGGRGLIGLTERAHAAGGSLQAGSHHNGYRLTATLPL